MSDEFSISNVNGEDLLKSAALTYARNYGDEIVPEAIVLHYTAGGSAKSTIEWLSENDQEYVSAHIVVARNGAITQMVPFNFKAFHAGISEWQGRRDLNAWSIGIEIANWGFLKERSDGALTSWAGRVVERQDAAYATHKYGAPSGYWEKYEKAQIESVERLCRFLCRYYGISIVVGHDDVAPGRKADPGPLFPIDDVRAYSLFVDDESDLRVDATYNDVVEAVASTIRRFTS